MTEPMKYPRIRAGKLTGFCSEIFRKLGLPRAESETTVRVLVEADMRGIPSHGIGRMRRYANGLKNGQILPHPEEKILRETPSTIAVDAGGGMGPPVSKRVMGQVIAKAEQAGAAFGCVRNSNHFGIAGYYAMMALEHDMIGIAMTNTAALGVPTFGRQVMFGTNPLAFCAPADREGAFVLDMSTTVVTRGKLEVCEREGWKLSEGWAVDRNGLCAVDPKGILNDMLARCGGGILPLGGEGEVRSGFKGYGLAVMVDILCAVLCGAPFGPDVYDTPESSARVSHFFGAVKIDAFRDPALFRADMDRMLAGLRMTPPAEGEKRVWFAGEKEFENVRKAEKEGVPLSPNTLAALEALGTEYGVAFPWNTCRK
ncbi:MAG: putative oxidoreductase YjmC [Lentisphaerae bacterium ADurb.Bin242]|nr:MAG: putative oxidoreductase YjmC [Lentisphaerae bacterium ADurb.Bin242]